MSRFDREAALRSRLGSLDPPGPIELLALTLMSTAVMYGTWVGLDGYHHQLLAGGHRFFAPASPLDAAIPLVPEMVWVYMLYFPAFYLLLPLTAADRRVLYQSTIGYCTIAILATLIYFVLPSRMDQPDLSHCASLSCRVLDRFYRTDDGFNIFPSEHVAYPTFTWLFFRRYFPAACLPFGVVVLGIWASTVLLHRHYLVDIPGGVAVAVMGYSVAVAAGTRASQYAARLLTRRAAIGGGAS